MKAEEFDELGVKKKGLLVMGAGVFLAQRYYYCHWVPLYAINNLYVEVHYFQEENEIGRIEAVKDAKIIDSYLDTICLDLNN